MSSLVIEFAKYCISSYQKHRWEKLQRDLVDAIVAGNMEAIERACERGADPNDCSPYGTGPAMFYAVTTRSVDPEVNVQMVRLLERFGGDLNVTDHTSHFNCADVARSSLEPLLWPERVAAKQQAMQEWLAGRQMAYDLDL